MTYEEFKERLTTVIANPDTAQTAAMQLLDDVKLDYTERDTYKDTMEKAEKRVRDLQDTNQKLFLMATGSPAKTGDDEPEGEAAVDAFVNELMKEE